MCGLAGWVARSDELADADLLRRMVSTLVHRGPDGEGYFHSHGDGGRYKIALGHRRLAIIDLEGGSQPMIDRESRLAVAFNGEIYNFRELREELRGFGHVFSTGSDTEVILKAYTEWGDGCVERFRGMFAFALWDARQDRLLLARDPFGKKPLFLLERGSSLWFASEIKALLAVPGNPAEVDLSAVWDYLVYRYVPGPATLFSGIRKLPPGTLAVWEKGRLEERVYYTPPDREPWRRECELRDPVGAFLARLDDAVRIRLVSDVPYGAFLSGGIDSSAVVALMARHVSSPVRTFSVGFSESRYSELVYARAVAKAVGTEHHELVVGQEQIVRELPLLIRHRDAPVSEPSDIPMYLLAREAYRTVKMVLTGEGSDEILGGYPKHVFERFATPYRRFFPGSFRRGLLEPLAHALPYGFRRAKTVIANMSIERDEDRLPGWFGAMSPAERVALVNFPVFRGVAPAAVPNGIPRCFDLPPGNSPLRRILYFDQRSWLADNLLERGDRMTMAASVEARMPFMDQDLAAYVSSMPDRFRVRGRRTKWILREAMKKILSRSVIERTKVGFRVPVNEWFREGLREFVYDLLAGPGSMTRFYYRAEMLDRVLKEHMERTRNHEKLLWALLNLELWHREYLGSDRELENKGMRR